MNQYTEDEEFALKVRMLVSLAFVPEHEVIPYFNSLMLEFPSSAIEIADYFGKTYIGRVLPDHSRRIPQFPTRIWNQYTRTSLLMARTNNYVEGWHNGFQTGINCAHPTFTKMLRHLQLEQSFQEVILTKWEAGEATSHSKESIARSKLLFQNMLLEIQLPI